MPSIPSLLPIFLPGKMNSKAFIFLSLLFAVVLLTSSMVPAETSLDEKNGEAADEKANQAADASTQDGGGHGGGTHTNERGINFLSCAHGCCALGRGGGAGIYCIECCSNQEEALNNMKNEPHA